MKWKRLKKLLDKQGNDFFGRQRFPVCPTGRHLYHSKINKVNR